jgi:hypothetical protein
MGKPFIDMTARRFGRLYVIQRDGVGKDGKPQWQCRCDCGNITTVSGQTMRQGATRSCGCIHREIFSSIITKHGQSKRPEYQIFCKIKGRCNNSANARYSDYGGRGIQMIFTSFDEFLADIGPRPTPQHSIDRIDNEGHYGPGNVRWATAKDQANNKRNNRRIILDGHSLTLAQAATAMGLSYGAAKQRLNRTGHL